MPLPPLALAATLAPAAGALAVGALGVFGWPRRRTVGLLAAGALGGLAALLVGGGAAALVGLAFFGASIAGPDPRRALARAPVLLVLAAVLDAAPSGGGLFPDPAPFSARTTARLLDLSPRVLVLEASGADWMRHPTVYGPAGADRIGPDLRIPHTAVAGRWLLVLGWVLLALRLAAAPSPRAPDDCPCPTDASTAPSPRR